MTTDDIIDMACAAKLGRRVPPFKRGATGDVFYTDNSYRTSALEDFARMVIAAEREACARECVLTADDIRQQGEGAHDGRYEWMADGAMRCADEVRKRGAA